MLVNPDRVLKTISAIEAGDNKLVRMMLKAGVPANHFVAGTFAADQRSLAHYAATGGQFAIFETLIAAGADIDALELSSWRPPLSMLECACSARSPSLEIVQKILKEGHPSQEHLNQSLIAASYGEVSIVDALLLAGADPNFTDANLDTPLIVAILSDREDVALRLLDAGADASGSIKNKERAPFWKKTIQEAVGIKAMDRLANRLGAANGQASANAKPRRVNKPKTIESCWKQIDDWLARSSPSITLPSPFDFADSLAGQDLLLSPVAEQIRRSLGCHDGTADCAIVDVPDDAAYELLSVKAALEVRVMLHEVQESECPASSAEWWSDSWWPFADNGGGDLLVVDCSNGAGQVLKFSHETRTAIPFKKSVLDLLQSIAASCALS